MRLYSYFRSSSAYRARIALNLKGIAYEIVPVHLLRGGGQQNLPEFLKKNPMGQVPVLEVGKHHISQSMSILLYLEERYGSPHLLSMDRFEKYQQIEICEDINSGIQPLQNLAVLNELTAKFGATTSQRKEWCQRWIDKGLSAIEKKLSTTAGSYSFGGEPSAVDCYLIPQMFSARRMGVQTNVYPTLTKIEQNCLKLPAFESAKPENQPDFEADAK